MANEIQVSVSLSASKGGMSVSNSGSRSATMAGDQMISNMQVVGTAAEQLSFVDVSTVGYVLLKNLDSANFVQIALDSGVSTAIFAKLLAGDMMLFPAATATMYAKADTASVNLLIQAVEL